MDGLAALLLFESWILFSGKTLRPFWSLGGSTALTTATAAAAAAAAAVAVADAIISCDQMVPHLFSGFTIFLINF